MTVGEFSRVTSTTSGAVKRLQVRTAINSMLWLTGIATPICFFASWLLQSSDPTTARVIAGVGVLPIIVAVYGFIWLLHRNPEKLQSEEFQVQHQVLQVVQARGDLDPKMLVSMIRAVVEHRPTAISSSGASRRRLPGSAPDRATDTASGSGRDRPEGR